MCIKVGSTRLLILLGLLFCSFGLGVQAESKSCYSAAIPAVMVLPDDVAHPPGRLRICASPFSPAAARHVISVDEHQIGYYLSRITTLRVAREDRVIPTFLFVRRDDDAWVLYEYTVPDAEYAAVYDLTPRGRSTATWRLAQNTSQDRKIVVPASSR